ncbi:type VII secretion integral membrane protein EccD [Mycobacterium deserti]|uniref:Type VII secretion integral membrane protein EccD n=1 Tax=Mycobacterium deserti TaxID=2978347 RepID=A0ABT2MBP0_9MYCO|nr:type VII secretion integral membrane protein EccD [Mycobacterium deserti]MCT7659687.1 type VII secretion integral membrane protein EccD [Mycobacterium deserti]
MTLPPSLSDLDPDSESEHELSRLTLVVGSLKIDVGLPAEVSIAEYVDDVIDIANEQLAMRNPVGGQVIDASANKWTLARLNGEPIEPHRSLSEAGVYDGDLIMVREVAQPVSPLLFDDVDDGPPELQGVRSWLVREATPLTSFGVGLGATTTLASLVPRWAADPVVPAAVLGLGLAGVALACALAFRPTAAAHSAWVTTVALPLVFAGSLFVVPDGFGVTSLPMAFALVALSSLVVLLISSSGRALHTAVIAGCTFGGVGATALLLWQPPPRTVGAIMATIAVIVVYLAPRVTIALSKLPIPRVPTAGEPLDDIETQGGTTVEGVNAIGKQIIPTEEGLIRRVRRANEHLTGILVGAAFACIAGSYLALDVSNGFFWQGTAFAVVVATVLCLRGRGHHDLVQSAVLIGSGLTIAIVVIVKTAVYVEDWQIRSLVGLAVLTALVVACGLVAPRREFSPVARRWVEIGEYVAIGLMFPLCFWIIRLYAFFRELRI